MIEKLFPLDPPPGLYHNGTRNQAAGRWYDANGVRFYQGNKQPIGGWTQRTITGAANSGVPNAAITLLRNDNSAFLIYGTNRGLFVLDSSNVRHDITPSVLAGQTTLDWSLETFGEVLVAAVLPAINANGNNIYKWEGDTSVVAALAAEPYGDLTRDSVNYFDMPNTVKAVVTTPERFLFCLQGADPAVGLSVTTTHAVTYRAARSGAVQTIDIGQLIID